MYLYTSSNIIIIIIYMKGFWEGVCGKGGEGGERRGGVLKNYLSIEPRPYIG